MQLQRSDYTVGWLCALPLTELVAARCMLDATHLPPLDPPPADDANAYFYGSISGHNVVICSLPVGIPGKVSAAIQAQSLLRSFSELTVCLFVGIGGGVPWSPPKLDPREDVHLGDVVVGWPGHAGEPGVVQYDFYRRKERDEHASVELLAVHESPDRRLLNAMGSLLANHRLGLTKFAEHLARMSHLPSFEHPGTTNDRLFNASYSHRAGFEDCSECDPAKLVDRASRLDKDLVFHQSTILSGDMVMKDAQERDRLSNLFHHARCFEMEAAGTVGARCLVIRGISDYADSHKNSSWQCYAAATAAAFARELLYTLQPQDVERTKSLDRPPVPSIGLVPVDGTDGTVANITSLNIVQAQSQDPAAVGTILLPQLFPLGLLKLGQFLPYPLRPTIDSFDPFAHLPPLKPVEDYISYPPSLYEVLVSLDSKQRFVPRLLHRIKSLGIGVSALSGSGYVHIKSDSSVYHSLRNSNAAFAAACRSDATREWLRMRYTRRAKVALYFVVGLQELRRATVIRTAAGLSNAEGSGLENVVAGAGLTSGIVGVEVRRVECRVGALDEPVLDEETAWRFTYQRRKGSGKEDVEYNFCSQLGAEDVAEDVVKENGLFEDDDEEEEDDDAGDD